MHDIAVVGLGPAGRCLAHHCATLGLSVLALDPDPQRVWTPTYGVWEDEIAGLLPASVAAARLEGPVLRSRRAHTLPRTYVVLDNAAVQEALHLRGVDVRRARLHDHEVTALRDAAGVVVDARGARPAGGDPGSTQTAYGIVVPTEAARPALLGHPGFLMDWTPDWTTRRLRPADVPTFLYAVPLAGDRMLLEETALAADPALPMHELQERLRTRLLSRGVDMSVIEAPLLAEHVVIPMRGRGAPPPAGAIAFGVAGRGGNIVTGYSVAASLRAAPRLAHAVAAGDTSGKTVYTEGVTSPVREAGLRALLQLSAPGTLALFEAFGSMAADRQRAFLDRDTPAGPLVSAMTEMWLRMYPAGQADLVRATCRGAFSRRDRRL